MGYPDPQQNPGQPGANPPHPGGQNYPPQPGEYRPTRPIERGDYDGTQGYQLGYGQGAYGPQDGTQPPQGPPPGWDGPGGPGGPGGPQGPGGGGGGNRKMLWIAAGAVAVVLILAVIVVIVATGGSDTTSASSTRTTTSAPPTTTSKPPSAGFTLPSTIPSISIPPIFGGGSTTGPNARQWRVEVTGSGSAQLITVGIPDTGLFGSQPLPWSKAFTSNAFMVTVTVIGYSGEVSCKITRNGTVVSEESAGADAGGGAPLVCSASP